MAGRGQRASLATLLKLRHARTEQARAELAAVRLRRREAEAAIEDAREGLAGARLGGAEDFATAVARRAWHSAALTAGTQVLAAIVAEEDAAAVRYHADRRSELVIEKLVERIEAERLAVVARAEQAALDELALTRHARQQQRAARSPRGDEGEAA